jgi:tetratricopeptide (TPR) repeat protein
LSKYKVILICAFLAGATLAVYWQVLSSDFVNFDDTIYVTENEHVKTGFNWDNIKWAFAAGTVAYWHPLTWLSHTLDCQLYGLRPGLHHLTNLIIHIVNSLLLFLVFRQMTGAVWRSALVAALFALHPINVDSVAWIAERKNVLSTLFWLLTMWAYASYARRGGITRYLAALLLFALGLLAKPMLVTLPFVMLLLDYWPFRRFRLEGFWRLVWEKIPFYALSAVSVYLSYLSVRRLGITLSTQLVPIKLRVTNAVVSYVAYIGKIILPRRLAVFYPYPQEVAMYQALGALLFLICVSVVLIWVFRNRPYLGMGWLWFISTLVPVIGFMQAGLWPAMADRWAYVPLIGIGIIIAWGVGDIVAKWRLRTSMVVFAAGACLSALMLCTWLQVGHWHNSYTLFTHALNVTSGNYIAHLNLGNVFLKEDKVHEAISQYDSAIAVHKDFAEAHYNLGIALGLQEEYDRAISQYYTALRLKKDHWKARFHLANALAKSGRLDEAISQYEKVIELRPGDAEVHNNFALALTKKGKIDKAIEHYNRCLQIEPDSVEVLNNLANALAEQRKFEQAVAHFKKALSLKPDFVQTYYNLANVLRETGQLDEAAAYYRGAIQLDPSELDAYVGLGLVLVRQGQYNEAVEQFETAIQLNPDCAQAYYNLGKIFADRNEFDKAVEQFRQVLRIVPNDAEMHCNLGVLLAQQSKIDEAIKEFRTALELDPNLSRAREQLELALARKSAANPP